jgi:hypothetical protein
MIEPERRKRAEISTYGGKVSRLMRMPRYVVPQKKQTASSARKAVAPGCWRKLQGNIAVLR